MERRNNGNPLMYKAALLYSELAKADSFMRKLKKTLDECNENDDLTRKIGIPFIAKMPRFKILEREADEIKQKLRRVCSGEVSLEEARKRAMEYEKDIEEVLQVIDEDKILPYLK